MDEPTLRTLFINTVLVANADGRVVPEERAFLKTFAERAGITPAQMRTWLAEIRAGEAEFQALDTPEHRDLLFALMIGTASSDGALSDAERDALLTWGHALGLSPETVRKRAQTLWREDVLTDLFPRQAADAHPHDKPLVLVITDHFESLDAMLTANPEVAVTLQPMSGLPGGVEVPPVIVFHAQEDTASTLEMLARVQRQLPKRAVVVVLNRHQAFQISYLYDAQAQRCLVEPVYPGELAGVLDELGPRT